MGHNMFIVRKSLFICLLSFPLWINCSQAAISETSVDLLDNSSKAALHKIGFFITGESSRQNREACTAVAFHGRGVLTAASCVFGRPGTSEKGLPTDLHQQPFIYTPEIASRNGQTSYQLEYVERLVTDVANIAVLKLADHEPSFPAGAVAPLATYHPREISLTEVDVLTGQEFTVTSSKHFKNFNQIKSLGSHLVHPAYINFNNQIAVKKINRFSLSATKVNNDFLVVPASPFASESGPAFVRGAPYLLMDLVDGRGFRAYVFGMRTGASSKNVVLITRSMARKLYDILNQGFFVNAL